MMSSKHLILGIDLGTTSIKATLLDSSTRKPTETFRTETKASDSSVGKDEYACESQKYAVQDVKKILQTLERTLGRIPESYKARISKVAVCGQMHGCMFWKSSYASSLQWLEYNKRVEGLNDKDVSHLLSWEDGRCSKEFLSSLPSSDTGIPISTGFGCATIFWLAANDAKFLGPFDCSGTVQDFVVSLLCGLNRPVMSTQNAVSWGYYDVMIDAWETERLQSAGFPVYLLPDVQEPGTIAGHLQKEYHGIPKGTPVGVALGDFQCSVLACLGDKTNAVLNIGTSSQLAVISAGDKTCHASTRGIGWIPETGTKGIQVWPYFNGDRVVVAASLTGGNVLAKFVETLQDWMRELSISNIPNKDELYTRLLHSAKDKDTTLCIRPTLWGERHSPELKGEISGLTCANTTLGDITSSLCYGIINNLHDMMPKEWMMSCGVQSIIGTGNALMQNMVLQRQVQQVWGLPLVMSDGNDASFGAALSSL